MALLTEIERAGDTGIRKVIDPSAVGIILDLVQQYQYQFPIASTIREVVSNGVDSVKEKEIAIEILSGRKTESDFFVLREGGIYTDSNFDPSYYSLPWLSREKGVTIDFIQHVDKKDTLRITDHGVGLGGIRLEKYFSIGYSSKRNLKTALGKFGIGAKSPLSINQYFTMRSTYNGYRFEFMVYSDKIDSIVPSLNLETGGANYPFTFSDGYVIYGIPTSDQNSVQVEVEIKHHQRSQVIDGVKTQLMYFRDVEFKITPEDFDHPMPTHIAADIIYENQDIIVTRNNRYSKPHLVLNNVNYGYLNFLELELEEKVGPVGIKMDPDEVEVSPSRESVIWSDKTRMAVINKFKKVQLLATTMVEDELKNELDYLSWAIKCSMVVNKGSDADSVMAALGGLIDTSQIKPIFPGDTQTAWEYNTTAQFACWRIVKLIAGSKLKPKRDSINWSEIDLEAKIYVQEAGEYTGATDYYLYNENEQDIYILIKPDLNIISDVYTQGIGGEIRNYREGLLMASPLLLQYEGVIVPEDYCTRIEIEEKEDLQQEKEKNMSLAEIRKIQGSTLIRMPVLNSSYSGGKVIMSKVDIAISAIPDLPINVVFGLSEDRPLLEALFLLLNKTGYETVYPIYMVSQEASKYFLTTNFTYVKDWFHKFHNGHLTMHPYLVGLNTARLLKEMTVEHAALKDISFLNGFMPIDSPLQDQYRSICDYIEINFDRTLKECSRTMLYRCGAEQVYVPQMESELLEFMKKLTLFQDSCIELTDSQVKALSLEIFGVDTITSAYAYDRVETDKLKHLLEETTPYRTMMKGITQLTEGRDTLSQDLEMEIKNYIAYKKGL